MTPTSKLSIVALIPARSGSKRVPGKNTKLLAGKPLVQYTIEAAKASGIFERIIVSTDSRETAEIAMSSGVRWSWRAAEHATDEAPDILWIKQLLERYEFPEAPDAFAILRPTSPFRTAASIKLAWQVFQATPCDSLRAVRYANENPYKMWQPYGMQEIQPLIDEQDLNGTPWHSLPSQQTMGTLYIQTGGLEMAWTRVVQDVPPTISGVRVIPFHLEGPEAFDINTPEDWAEAERICQSREPQPVMEYLG